MTARIDLAKLERVNASHSHPWRAVGGTIRGKELDDESLEFSYYVGHGLAPSIAAMRNALPALIAAVRALREAEELIADMLPYCMEAWDWKYGQYWNDEHAKVRAALAAFDFKEEAK